MTRGGIGFRFNGEDKICFVDHDADPLGTGIDLLKYLKRHSIEELKEICSKIICTDDWKVEGWDGKEFHSKIFESSPFLNNSLYCEYAYIINLDDGVLEYYRGGNQNPNAKGRYAHNKAPTICFEYYGVRLTQEVQLNEINKYKVTNNYEEPFTEGSEQETNVMDNKELTFKGSIKFVDGKMVTTIDVLDDGKIVSTSTDSVDCDINQIVADPSKVALCSAAPDGKENQEVETFSSGIWTILLKDVLKTVGSVLVAQLKKKVQEKLKDKFGSKD